MTKKYLHDKGRVERIFADDNKGSRHQKFTVKLKNNKSVLVVHNIDISRRINGLKLGDMVEFYGVYQWNRFGGLVHWTHQPKVSDQHLHKAGWVKHNGILYQ
ncbi:MAG: DUF3465 domain-containing protein [Cognaticolwellia sp.]